MLFQIKYPADLESVQIAGNFNSWTGESGKIVDGSYVFNVKFDEDLVFKFIVNGEWRVHPEYEIVKEGFIENNRLSLDKGIKEKVAEQPKDKESTQVALAEQPKEKSTEHSASVPTLIGGLPSKSAVNADTAKDIAVGLPEDEKKEVPLEDGAKVGKEDGKDEVVKSEKEPVNSVKDEVKKDSSDVPSATDKGSAIVAEPLDLDTVPNLIKPGVHAEDAKVEDVEDVEDAAPVKSVALKEDFAPADKSKSTDLKTDKADLAPVDLATVPHLIKKDTKVFDSDTKSVDKVSDSTDKVSKSVDTPLSKSVDAKSVDTPVSDKSVDKVADSVDAPSSKSVDAKDKSDDQVFSYKSGVLSQKVVPDVTHAPIPDAYSKSIDTEDIDTTKYSLPLSKSSEKGKDGSVSKAGNNAAFEPLVPETTSADDVAEKSIPVDESKSPLKSAKSESVNTIPAAVEKSVPEVEKSKSAPLLPSGKSESGKTISATDDSSDSPAAAEAKATTKAGVAAAAAAVAATVGVAASAAPKSAKSEAKTTSIDDTSDFEPPAKDSPAKPVDAEIAPSVELVEPVLPLPKSAESASDYKSANTTLPSLVSPSISKPFLDPIDNDMNDSFMSARTGLNDSDILSTDSTEIVGSQQSSFAAISESESHFEKIDHEDEEFIDAEDEDEEDDEDDETPVHSRVNSSTNIKSYSDSTSNIPGSFVPTSPDDKRGSLIQKFKSFFKY